jgi:hypothetical protein
MIHRPFNYDYDERIKAMWEGYEVEFSKSEYVGIKDIQDLKVLSSDKKSVVVKYDPTKSGWEDMFQ